MSTRCHILFTDGDASLLTYKHFDGHPENVIQLLRDYWQWYPRTERLEYLTATWFYYCKRQREMKSVESDWHDAPMATDELDHNHPVALSYGICADNKIHGDTEHFYEVNIEQETVSHYTPDNWGFESADSPADVISREPDRMYRLTCSNTGDSRIEPNNSSDSPTATDGGTKSNTEQSDRQVKCSRCGRTKNVVHTAESGTPAGDYLGLVGSSTAGICNRCCSRLPEETSPDDDFDLLEFDGWERQITTNDSRFVSAVWQSDAHTIMLDAVGDGEWTVSWVGKDEDSEQIDDWYSQYEAREFAVDQIQQMIRLIKSGAVSVSESVEMGHQDAHTTGGDEDA